ncbi:hypothetical protein QUF72_13695 [Desulfobacterales bacterium HSG2]|nr:hypothetical protein [Desulfobacterales bacterium HSG2]
MSEAERRDEAPLYVNRKASTFIVRENGKIVIKERGEKMSISEETDSTVVPPEKPKPDGTEAAGGFQGTGGGLQGAGMDAGIAHIDKIRDIIFGNQMQDYEKRFSRVEERLFKEMSASKTKTRKDFDSLEQIINKEVESMKDRMTVEQTDRSESLRNIERQLEEINRSLRDQVKVEQATRSESLKKVERQLRDLTRSVEKRIDNLEEQIERNSQNANRQTLEQSQTLRGEIRQKYEEISSSIDRMVQELRISKVDRSSLSDFFNEMAMRITNEKD